MIETWAVHGFGSSSRGIFNSTAAAPAGTVSAGRVPSAQRRSTTAPTPDAARPPGGTVIVTAAPGPCGATTRQPPDGDAVAATAATSAGTALPRSARGTGASASA